ncbi:MAG: ABC transporter substrate-binding protein [Treponema sp.]|jgi:ABC-type Fe3+-hydroxamate transport system substrate-binding protein|nr:ABC transporter substrate-binding protein [Treponema sp.]
MKKRMITALILSVLVSAALISCSNAKKGADAAKEAESFKLVDALDREITIQGPVERVYYGFYYENLLAIVGPEAFTKVVATSLHDTEGYFLTLSRLYREYVEGYNDMIDIGSTFHDDFNIEKLLELDLDAVILGAYQYTDLVNRIPVLENAGIPVVVIDYTLGTMEMQCKSTEILGKLFGVEDRARRIINQYAAAYEDIARRTAAIGVNNRYSVKKKTFGEFHSTITSYNEIGTSAGSGSFLSMYMEKAGGENIMIKFMEQSDQLRIDPEYLLEADPDAIFFIGGESTNKNKDGVVTGHQVNREQTLASAGNIIPSRPGWDTLKAVQENQIFVIENGICRTMADYTIVQFMGKSMYPELFEDVDPLENLKAYYAEYLPSLPLEGIFFYNLSSTDID